MDGKLNQLKLSYNWEELVQTVITRPVFVTTLYVRIETKILRTIETGITWTSRLWLSGWLCRRLRLIVLGLALVKWKLWWLALTPNCLIDWKKSLVNIIIEIFLVIYNEFSKSYLIGSDFINIINFWSFKPFLI